MLSLTLFRPLSLIRPEYGFQKYTVCVWWTVVTMTTIGYGDFYPRTFPGRCLTFILAIWGVIVVSLTVVALSSFVEPTNRQEKAFAMIKMIDTTLKRKLKAAELTVLSIKAHGAFHQRRLGWLKEINFMSTI